MMRRIVSVGDERCAVQGCRSNKMFRISSGGGHYIATAHAKADRALAAAAHELGAVEEFQNCTGIIRDHFVGQFWPRLDRAKFFTVKPVDRDGLILLVPKFEMDSLAAPIVEVRNQTIVADSADAPGDIVELFAQAPDVHVNNYRWKRTVLFRMSDERIHDSIGSADFDESLAHRAFLSNRKRLSCDEFNSG